MRTAIFCFSDLRWEISTALSDVTSSAQLVLLLLSHHVSIPRRSYAPYNATDLPANLLAHLVRWSFAAALFAHTFQHHYFENLRLCIWIGDEYITVYPLMYHYIFITLSLTLGRRHMAGPLFLPYLILVSFLIQGFVPVLYEYGREFLGAPFGYSRLYKTSVKSNQPQPLLFN